MFIQHPTNQELVLLESLQFLMMEKHRLWTQSNIQITHSTFWNQTYSNPRLLGQEVLGLIQLILVVVLVRFSFKSCIQLIEKNQILLRQTKINIFLELNEKYLTFFSKKIDYINKYLEVIFLMINIIILENYYLRFIIINIKFR